MRWPRSRVMRRTMSPWTTSNPPTTATSTRNTPHSSLLRRSTTSTRRRPRPRPTTRHRIWTTHPSTPHHHPSAPRRHPRSAHAPPSTATSTRSTPHSILLTRSTTSTHRRPYPRPTTRYKTWMTYPSAPPPPPKRARTAFDDMCTGKKPLKMSRSHVRRKKLRTATVQRDGHAPSTSTFNDHVRPALDNPLQTTLDATRLPAAHGGYAARVESADEMWGSKKRHPLPELLGLGFQLVRWNGYDSRPIVDVFGRIITVLVGQPHLASWDAEVASAYQHISAESAVAAFCRDLCKHRRGGFVAQNVGIYYGQGAKFPTRLRTGMYEPMLDRLLGNPAVARMATFASAAFALWAPRLHQYYCEHANKLHDHYPHLRRNFPRSVFSCAAFNFGPSVWTVRHRDVLNVPFGWCAVQSGGEFDATQGGHLVLWDLKLMIEFPAGALILLPSATIAHSNIPIAPGQTRISFTHYTAGGLMRFVDNRFRTNAEVEAEDPEEFARLATLKDTWWEMGLKLLSMVNEILESLPDAE
ncbi:hypothetical protein B0H17DRAFT_1006854 [Mycena rosella]|uniref:Uncharacterized protein n=1 Tax=Mycena rosella TaxID=1033263 RepID=A0AAD7DTY9_MYCRO|nr:hypothetical protein B0H17DRAFT_1006854 [Mycena rosella]